MPTWETHLEIAKRIAKRLKFKNEEYEEFLLANLLPDRNCAYAIEDVSKVLKHSYTHYNNFLDFYLQKKKYMNNITVFGYFSHLFSDYIWNNNFYTKKIKNFDVNKLSKDEIRFLKQNDFRFHGNLYYENRIDIKNLNIFLDKIKVLDKISLNKNDLEKILKYINDNEYELKKINLTFYTKEELENLCNETVDKIIEFKEKIIDQK